MDPTKPRVFIALYALAGALSKNQPADQQQYHWALTLAPKNRKNEPKEQHQHWTRYRIIKRQTWAQNNPGKVEFEKLEWECEESPVPAGRHDDIVARVFVANIEDPHQLEKCVRRAWPEKTMHVKKYGGARTSRDWVRRVLEGLRGSEVYTYSKVADWETVERCCVGFAEKVGLGSVGVDAVPTFDIMKDREVFE